MDYNHKLGLYIPTYNRGKFLKELLNQIISQFSRYNLPIFISDNGSEDDTLEIINDARSSYGNIFVRSLPKNLGYAKNFLNVLSEGNTEYCWFFSDDDSLVQGAVDEIILYLVNNLDFYVVNCSIYDSGMKELLSPSALPFLTDRSYPPGSHEQLLTDTKYSHLNGFASAYIIKKCLVDEQIPLFRNSDQYFLPMILFYRAIVGRSGTLISKPLIKNRRGNESYSAHSIEVWFRYYPQALHSLGDFYSNYSINTANYGNIESRFNIQYTYTIQGIFHKNKFDFRSFLRNAANNYYINLRTKIILLFISLIPLKVKKIIVSSFFPKYLNLLTPPES